LCPADPSVIEKTFVQVGALDL